MADSCVDCADMGPGYMSRIHGGVRKIADFVPGDFFYSTPRGNQISTFNIPDWKQMVAHPFRVHLPPAIQKATEICADNFILLPHKVELDLGSVLADSWLLYRLICRYCKCVSLAVRFGRILLHYGPENLRESFRCIQTCLKSMRG